MTRSLLSRTFLLISALVLVTTAAWLVTFRLSQTEPRARELAQLAASVVNITRAALLAADPDKRADLFVELGTREGIRLLPAEESDEVEPLPDSRFFQLVLQELTTRLGPRTRLALKVDGVAGLWVSFHLDQQEEDEYWVILSRERADNAIAWHWISWGLVALVLALAVAWFIVSRITRPLRALGDAAESVGRGRMPDPLPETGAEELKQLAAAFNRMASDLTQHEQERAEVLAGISHDLRTPLTRLRLEAEISIADPATQQAVIGDIEQMEAVISQFLDYARGDAGEAPSDCDVAGLLQALAEREAAGGRPLVTAIAADLPGMTVRPKALLRAITNLVENAHKYGDGEVSLAARREDRKLVIEIADRGTGIPAAQAERLKRPFTRLEAARSNATGTGLGLAIVNRIAHLHGGQLDLLPRPGGGLLARLSLPLR